MNRASLPAAAVLAMIAGAAQTQPAAALNAPQDRISDAAIHADHRTYESLQARIKALNERGIGHGPRVADYHLSKAQCWLDVSLHEYTRNDRSAFPQAALAQSERLVKALESGNPPPQDTPLVNGADRLRKDLWDAAEELKKHAGWRCAQQQVACAEVELVHAGNEHRQQGWRHAKPYVQIAEDRIDEAKLAAERCVAPPPAPVAAAAPPPPPPPPAPKFEPLALGARVLFEFDKSDAASIRPDSRAELDRLVGRLRSPDVQVESIRLAGHADRLKNPAARDYNLQLSQRRAQTVAQLLAAAGIDRGLITVDSRGDSEQVADCRQPLKSSRELRVCLQENRRVQIDVRGTRRVP